MDEQVTTEETEILTNTVSKSDYEAALAEKDQWKNNHQSLQKRYQRVIDAGGASEEVLQRVDALTELVKAQGSLLLNSTDIDEDAASKLKAIQSQQDARNRQQDILKEKASRIGQLVEDAGLDWESSDLLTDARTAWTSGDVDGTLALTRVAATQARSKSSQTPEQQADWVKTEVDKQFQELKEKTGLDKVDTGQTVAGAKYPTLDDLNKVDVSKLNPKQASELREQMYTAMEKQDNIKYRRSPGG